MKKILGIMLAASALMSVTSCSDFLEEENKTASTAENIYGTTDGIEGLVRSCYAVSRGWWGKEAGLGLTECGTDLFLGGYDNKQTSLITYNITSKSLDGNTSDDACFDHYWELLYDGVDICNNALKYIDANINIGDTKKQQYRGEAYFCRALYNFQMVQTWGPIPYNEEPAYAQITVQQRVPEPEVYKKIIADCDSAISNFDKSGFKSKKSDGGLQARATYYAAKALKARVCLTAASWLGKAAVEGHSDLYAEAKEAAQDVIDNSGATFYTHYPDVWNLNNEAVQDNKEAIWGVYYDNDLSTENCIPYRYKSTTTNLESYNSLITRTGYTRGGSAMNLMFVSMWSNGVASDGLGGNSVAKTNLFIRTLGDAKKNTFVNSAKTGDKVDITKYYSPYGRGFTRYLPSLYLWRLLDGIKDKDQRFEGTMLTHYNCPKDLEQNASKYYPKMGEFIDKPENLAEAAYERDGNYFNAGDTAIYYSALDGDGAEGQALQAWAKGRYRLQFATGGDIPVYNSNDLTKATPTKAAVNTSAVYQDTRYNTDAIGGWKSYPGLKKFLDDQYDSRFPTHDLTYRDAIVFRLPEMYFIVAEADLAANDNAGALAALNTVQEARAIDQTNPTSNDITGTVDIDKILECRAIELCGEQLRWFDLKRTHKLVEYVQKRNGAASTNVKTIHYYRPIPEAQIEAVTNYSSEQVSQDANGVLQYSTTSENFWQNPGY